MPNLKGRPIMLQRPHETPNPQRVAAGRISRLKRKGFTPEGLDRLRQAALANQPWLYSTGPRTPEGKAKVAMNVVATQRKGTVAGRLRRELKESNHLLSGLASCRRLAGAAR